METKTTLDELMMAKTPIIVIYLAQAIPDALIDE